MLLRNVISLLIISLLGIDAPAQTFNKSYSHGLNQLVSAVVQWPDGGYTVCGFNMRANPTSWDDGMICRFDSTGNLIWNKCYRADSSLRFWDILPSTNGSVIVAGETYENTCHQDPIIMKIDSVGNIVWKKSFHNVSPQHLISSLQRLSDSTYILSGNMYHYGYGNFFPTIICFDDSGIVRWEKKLDQDYLYGANCLADSMNNLFWVGTSGTSTTVADTSYPAAVQIDSSGMVVHTVKMNLPAYCQTSVKEAQWLDDSLILFVIHATECVNYTSTAYLVCMNKSFEVRWTQRFNGNPDIHLSRDNHSGFYFYLIDPNGGGTWVYQYDASGTLTCGKYLQAASAATDWFDLGFVFNKKNHGILFGASDLDFNVAEDMRLISIDTFSTYSCHASSSSLPSFSDSLFFNDTITTGFVNVFEYQDSLHLVPYVISFIDTAYCAPQNTSSIPEVSSSPEIKIYPNPTTSGYFRVIDPDHRTSRIEIHNLSDEILFNSNLQLDSEIKVPLVPGIYLVYLFSENEFLGVKKLVVPY